MNMGLENKVVIITGASSGIGKSTAMLLAKEGCRLAICSTSPSKLEAAKREMLEHTDQVFARALDVSDYAAMGSFIDDTVSHYGRVDMLYNNAAIGSFCYLTELSLEEWQHVMDVNLTSAWQASIRVAKYMKEQRSGAILFTTSLAARIATTAIGVYAISKTGINAMTKLLASELAPYGIRVNSISPGVVMTEMLKKGVIRQKGIRYVSETAVLQRPSSPDEIAKAAAFLLSDASSYITGEILDVSGGKFIVQDPGAPWDKDGIPRQFESISL